MYVVNQSPVSIMGVLNVTPDSFSDGGKFFSEKAAIAQAETLIAEGASIIDIGGESSRPGASVVSKEEELKRILPVLYAIRDLPNVKVSVDTYKPEVMEVVLSEGAWMINDVYGLCKPGAIEVIAKHQAQACIMHMQGTPQSMKYAPTYGPDETPNYAAGVVEEVSAFFKERLQACEALGLPRSNIMLDPGFAFGKSVGQSLTIIKRLAEFKALGCPLLVGVSRKSPIGDILDLPPTDRLIGSVSLAMMATLNGANVLRVHDVKETLQMLKICHAMDAV
jgi:dihydropteroate synthase